MNDRLYKSVIYLFVSIMFLIFILSSFYDGYNKGYKIGLVEGKKLISSPADAKEQIYINRVPDQIEPDKMPWKNRIKQLKHMEIGDSCFIHRNNFSMYDNGTCQIYADAEFNLDTDFGTLQRFGPIGAELKKTKNGYEVWLDKNDKFKSVDSTDAYIRVLTERWLTVNKIHFYQDGSVPWTK